MVKIAIIIGASWRLLERALNASDSGITKL
jgi:hypothetical protein